VREGHKSRGFRTASRVGIPVESRRAKKKKSDEEGKMAAVWAGRAGKKKTE